MGQASVSLSLITQQCLNKATSAQSAPLLLLVKLLHLLSFTSSSRPRLCPLFPTGERTVSEAHWAPYSAVSSLEMRFSSCWGLVFWGLCLFRADPKMKHKTQMRVFCFHCCVYAAAAGLVGGGETQSFVLVRVMNCKVNRVQAIMLFQSRSHAHPSAQRPSITSQHTPALHLHLHTAANICPKPQSSTQSSSWVVKWKTWNTLLVTPSGWLVSFTPLLLASAPGTPQMDIILSCT